MANSVYKINKGINKPIEFKGLKAQYIWWLGGGMVGLFILFVILYLVGVNSFLCIAIVGMIGAGLVVWVYGLSNRYGEHGMKKRMAARSVPDVIKSYSRKIFIKYGAGH